jgi:transcriptional regulator with XRE-family HTH domain
MNTLVMSIIINENMSTVTGQKIRAIRESLKLGRQEFCDVTGIAKGTLIRIETSDHEPNLKAVKAITNSWPQFTLWLLNDMVLPEAGQISPEIEEVRRAK